MGRAFSRRKLSASAAFLGMSLSVMSCGGGGSSPSPQPSNRAPTFTSSATASIAENLTGTAYAAAASDPDGDGVTITIAGGTDASAFTFAGGALGFVSPRNFDRPSDANFDNVYDVTLQASDGRGGVATLALAVSVTNDREGLSLARVGTGFGTDAVIAARVRGEPGLLVVSQDGTLRQIDTRTLFPLTLGNVFRPSESGRVLAVAHFNTYAFVLLDVGARGVIARLIPLPDSRGQEGAEAVVAAGPARASRAALFIGGDGFLFGALGEATVDQAQASGSPYGKFYRFQADPYCGASLVGPPCIRPELFGDGIHSPAGGGGYSGSSFLLDRGTDRQEEITFFNQGVRPLDFGWPYREGTFERVSSPPASINSPSITYAHGNGFFDGRGLTGGIFYSGRIAALSNQVIVTDESGKIFTFPATFLSDGARHAAHEMENRTADFAPTSGTIERPIGVVSDTVGRLFVLDGDGELFGMN